MRIGISNGVRASGVSGEDALVERLESARLHLAEALALPGMEGQAALFARLEDMREALEALGKRAAVGERSRGGAVLAVENCRRTLDQARLVAEFLRGVVEERASRSAGGVYAAEMRCARMPVVGGGVTAAWEG